MNRLVSQKVTNRPWIKSWRASLLIQFEGNKYPAMAMNLRSRCTKLCPKSECSFISRDRYLLQCRYRILERTLQRYLVPISLHHNYVFFKNISELESDGKGQNKLLSVDSSSDSYKDETFSKRYCIMELLHERS